MGNQLISGQWSLNETSGSVYSIARGVLEAATSDNVQPLAIMACEQFGNTLAISRETLLKVERTVLPTPEPVTIRFIKAKVGFMRHDCAVQLGSNQAGLRFLALAAALISSIPAFHCADTLALMLESTTSDRRLLPTRRHLADLMSSLEARCRLSGFADIVYGYSCMIRGLCPSHPLTASIPDSEGVAALVDACRHLQRIGDHGVSSIVVEARECAAWVAAFSKWSLELQPSIYLADRTPIIVQPKSQFTIIIPSETDQPEADIKVTKIFKLNSMQDLVVQFSSHKHNNYYVSLKVLGDIVQERLGGLKDAVLAALPLAITLLSESKEPKLETIDRAPLFAITRPGAFPTKNVIFGIMSHVFNLSRDFPFNSLASVKSFRDLPEVEAHFQFVTPEEGDWLTDFKFALDVKSYLWFKDTSEPDPHRVGSKQVRAFTSHLAVLCRYLLLLSTFDNIEDLYIVPPDAINDISLDEFDQNIKATLTKADKFPLPGYRVVWRSLSGLLAHSEHLRNVEDHIDILVSSTQTHVFWFSKLDSLVLKGTDNFCITYRRGRLMYEREVYHEISQKSLGNPNTTIEKLKIPLDSATQNFYPDMKTQWRLTPRSRNLHVKGDAAGRLQASNG
ncbi:hypothetical protein GQX73_g10859 [Xylaria multiplex]|uniref:Uncharacterized protein n=1 Tax=Xylaria multiplex TaxID=323545 RepID=A0A7C8MEV5_9PEZI|nr:hypothetical protein GQX73_g10859 [Xylaria multiplex]